MSTAPANPRKWIDDHIALYRADPEKAHYWDFSAAGVNALLPTLLLETKGRRSGTLIPAPLIYGKTDDGFVVIASRGGTPTHPDWYLNLVADPICEVQVGRDHHRARARVAEGDERARLWADMAKLYPPYDEYQQRAGGRVIPVVVLVPET